MCVSVHMLMCWRVGVSATEMLMRPIDIAKPSTDFSRADAVDKH